MRLELTGREVGNIDGNFGARTRGCGQRLAAREWARRHRFLHGRAIADARRADRGSLQAADGGFAKTSSATPRLGRNAGQDFRRRKEKTRGKTIAKKPASTNQAQSKRRTNQAQADEPAASPPKRQRPAGHVDLQFGFGHEGTIYSDDPCLTHPGHRIINGICIY